MRVTTMVMAGAVALATAGVLAGAGPVAAQPAVLYAAVTATGTGNCSDAADACTLSTALTQVAAGGVIELVTPGGDSAGSRYAGNWSVSTPGTSAAAPVTIEAAPGLSSQPVLDGDGPNAPTGESCSTASCNGPVLTVPGGEHVTLSAITIADGNNTSSGTGGGLDNAGTVAITGSTFTGNTATDGGAIDNGDGLNGGPGTGTVTVTASTFTGNTATDGGAIDSGDNDGSGTVTVTASTLSANTATGDGGAIASGNNFGAGTVTVTASTLSGNTATDGGAINSSENGGGGTVTVTASTLSGNTATDGGAIDSGQAGAGTVTVTASTLSANTATGDGGAIDSGDIRGSGTVTVTASTLSANTATGDGGAIDSGDHFGAGAVEVAGDVFDGSCSQPGGGTWTDGGYNAGGDGSCFSPVPAPGDENAGSSAALKLGPLAGNGGPTQTIAPQTGSPVIGIIADPTTVSLGGSQMALCPATDQRGYPSAAGTACDAGAVQTSGSPSALTLKDSATPASFNQAGQVISYIYRVRNTGAGTLSGITVTDPAVPGVSCPAATLPPGTGVICTGSYTITSADLAAGKITDTATAAAATTDGVPVASNTATVTVPKGWPPLVSGIFRPAAGAAEGYYLGVTGSTWSLAVTHPGTRPVIFTGAVTLNAGAFSNLTRVHLGPGDSAQVSGKTLTFHITDSGTVKGIRFATSPADTAITFTLDIGARPATAGQLYLGGTPTHPGSGSPLTFTR